MAAANQLTITRLYQAPVKLVWGAWTDPEQIAQWWGPRGFTHTTHSKDLRPGGQWRYTMHGPDGTDYPNITTYYVVDEYKRLEYDHGGNDERQALFRVNVTFTETDGKTLMEMTMTLPTPEAAREIEKFIKEAGGNATWDRLGEFLDKEQNGRDPFIINRSFKAPLERVFEMWTKPELLSQWLPPEGFRMTYTAVGKVSTYFMTNGEITHHGRMKYLTIEPHRRLIYTQEFLDETGNVSHHPHLPVWPETMLSTVTFEREGNEQTRVTVHWYPTGKFTAEELKVFQEFKASMTLGWSGSFNKLEDLLDRD